MQSIFRCQYNVLSCSRSQYIFLLIFSLYVAIVYWFFYCCTCAAYVRAAMTYPLPLLWSNNVRNVLKRTRYRGLTLSQAYDCSKKTFPPKLCSRKSPARPWANQLRQCVSFEHEAPEYVCVSHLFLS